MQNSLLQQCKNFDWQQLESTEDRTVKFAFSMDFLAMLDRMV